MWKTKSNYNISYHIDNIRHNSALREKQNNPAAQGFADTARFRAKVDGLLLRCGIKTRRTPVFSVAPRRRWW